MQTNHRLTLDDICEFVNGNGFRPEDWASEGLPIIRIQNLNGSTEFNYFSGQPKNKWLVQPGDILFAWAGVKGVSFGPTMWKGATGVLNQHIFRIVPKIEVNPYWLFAALKHVTARIEARAHGFKASLLHVQKADITEQVIEVPPLAQQRRIAEILWSWDEAIETTERLIAAKERRLDWVRNNLLTGVRRLPKFDSEWRNVYLHQVLNEHGLRSVGAEKVYSVSVHKGLVNQIEHLGRSFAASNTDHYNRVKPGDVVYTKSPTGDFPLGIIKQSAVDWDVIVSPLYGVFTPTTVHLGAILNCLFDSPIHTANYLRPLVQKGAKNTIAITNKRFLEGRLSLPADEDEQAALAELILTARMEIKVSKMQVDALARQKRGLMQKLLTGGWRVPLHDSEVDDLAERAATGQAA